MTSDDGYNVSHIGADDVDLQPGQVVGEYQVEAKIGEGGFGTVFRAAHPLIGKLVAIKVLNRQYSAQPDMVSRFVAEARAVNQIRHRNIIDIFSFGQLEDGRHYYVMEYLEGRPLDEHIAQRQRLALAEAIVILRMVARALDAAHGKGIAHRDLKPENIFLVTEEDGGVFPKLLDFGIAKLLSSEQQRQHKTRTGAPMGTPYYMSPEQCRGRDVDHRTDIYAFGVMTYQMLTGVLPFDGDDYMDILMKQIGEQPAPLSQHVVMPEGVDAAVGWMLAKDPDERPPNLVTAVRALEEAAVAAGIQLPTASVSGLHATSTGLVSGATPSSMPPITGAPSQALGSAATLDAAALSRPGDTPAPASPAATVEGLGRPPRGRGLLVGTILGGALAVVLAVVAVRALGDDPATDVARAASPMDAAPAAVPPTPPMSGEPADAAPTLPRLVTVTFEGAPSGAEVFGPQGLVGVAPVVQLPLSEETLLLTLKARGHETTTVEVAPKEDETVIVEMPRITRPGKKGGGRKDSHRSDRKPDAPEPKNGRNTLEDPF